MRDETIGNNIQSICSKLNCVSVFMTRIKFDIAWIAFRVFYLYFCTVSMLIISCNCSYRSAVPKAFVQGPPFGPLLRVSSISCHQGFHSGLILEIANHDADTARKSESNVTSKDASTKVKRKKLKGKRAVVRWLKHFRWKKKKEHQRMTVEEKMLYKLNKVCCILPLFSSFQLLNM